MGLTRTLRTRRPRGLALPVALALLLPILAIGPARAAADPIANLTPPVVTGEAVFGQKLHTDTGTWTPDGLTFTYRWLRDGVRIKGATRAGYRLGLDDLGSTVAAEVTAADGTGATLSAVSTSTAPVVRADFEPGDRPQVDGVRRYTRLLTASRGGWAPRPDKVTFRWLREGEPISGATRASYRLAPEDVGQRIQVEVTAKRAGYRAATALSVRTAPIGHRVPLRRTVRYHVETRGKITADLAEFKTQVQQTYDDPRGWRAAGIAFRRVKHGGAFTLVLAQASWVPRFSSECSATWSCRVGRFVIINQTRWQRASPAWNAAGRSRRDYRHMVSNHETGHWLGHGHASCPGRGRLAPVMMQQSKGTAGCRLNPWPLTSELWARPSGKGTSGTGSPWEARVWVG